MRLICSVLLLAMAGSLPAQVYPAPEKPIEIGVSAAESIAQTKLGHYTAFLPSLGSAYRVGHVVVDSIVANWAQDRERVPGGK
jgi:hypothetical protein